MNTGTGKVVVRCIIALVLALLIKWWIVPLYVELIFNVILIAGLVACELWQHGWKFSNMDQQAWLEWIVPAAVVIIVYSV
jgi:hypothetical protein